MKVIYLDKGEEIEDIPHLSLALGNFDGVHKGHQKLIMALKEESLGPTAVYLFDTNPASILNMGKSHNVLTSLEDKIRIFSSFGIEMAFVEHLTPAFFQKSKESFIEEIKSRIDPELIVVGSDYTFGSFPQGGPKDLKEHFKTIEVPLLSIKNEKVSTQEIIGSIERGEIERSNFLLGRPYEINGVVGHGYENGRKIGFPTANLVMDIPYVLPRTGVYLGICYSRGMAYKSLINVGTNPTVGLLKHRVVECYLDGLENTIYGETLYISFLSFLREEKKFLSLDALKEQIEMDKKSLLAQKSLKY